MGFNRLQQFYNSIHLTDPSWKGLNQIPNQKNGKPGWDTPESQADPEDHFNQPINESEYKGVKVTSSSPSDDFSEFLGKFNEEQLDGIKIWFNPVPPRRIVIDIMDWGSEDIGKIIGRFAIAFTGDIKSVIYHNEQGPPDEGKGWLEINPKKAIKESLLEGEYSYSSTQFNLIDAGYLRNQGSPIPKLQEIQSQIDPNDLTDKGLETELHITVKYGIQTIAPEDIIDAISGFGYVAVELGSTSIFPAEETTSEYDVVKVDVYGERLFDLNRLICARLVTVDKHPTYQPHITLAYVNPGTGEKYIGNNFVKGMNLSFSQLVFSDPDGNKTVISLLPSNDNLDQLTRRTLDDLNRNKDDYGEEHLPILNDQLQEMGSNHSIFRNDDGSFIAKERL